MACKCTQTTVNATAGGSTTASLSACTYPLWISMLSGCTAGLPASRTQNDILISNPSANIVFNTGYPEGCNDSYTTCNQYVNNLGINETRPQHTLSIGGTLDVRDYLHFSRGDAASLTGGSKYSVYLGYQAGHTRLTNANSTSNTAVGYKTLGSTGVMNGAIGNTSVGYHSLQSTTTGLYNTAIGLQAGAALTTGERNTLLGVNAGSLNNEFLNTSLGYESMMTTSTGSQNVAIGASAVSLPTTLGLGNVYIGSKAGNHVSTSGKGHVIIGSGSATGATTSNDVICLGYNAQPQAVDHYMNLGDVIYAGPGSTDGSAGRKAVGVNIVTPVTALDVKYENVVSLDEDSGGGSDIITFGVAGVGYAAHKLVQLRGAARWVPADADDITLQGNLIGIALGDEPELGILLKGYYNVVTADDITTWTNGGPVYVSTVGGKVTESIATFGPGDYVRIMGYMTTTANVIYFNPDNTFIVL